MATIYNCEFLEVAEGYKYLPKSIMDLVELYRKKENNELKVHPLIKAVAKSAATDPDVIAREFYSRFTRGGEARKAELLEEIDCCVDFNNDEKAILRNGLSMHYPSIELFESTFPYSRVIGEPSTVVKKFLDGWVYDEARLIKIVDSLSQFVEVINDMDVTGWVPSRDTQHGMFIHSTQVYTPKQKSILGKVTIPEKYQEAVYAVYRAVTHNDLMYYMECTSFLTQYIRVPNKDHYSACTKLPNLLGITCSKWVVDNGGFLEWLMYANETRTPEYYTLHFTLPSDRWLGTSFNILIK